MLSWRQSDHHVKNVDIYWPDMDAKSSMHACTLQADKYRKTIDPSFKHYHPVYEYMLHKPERSPLWIRIIAIYTMFII